MVGKRKNVINLIEKKIKNKNLEISFDYNIKIDTIEGVVKELQTYLNLTEEENKLISKKFEEFCNKKIKKFLKNFFYSINIFILFLLFFNFYFLFLMP